MVSWLNQAQYWCGPNVKVSLGMSMYVMDKCYMFLGHDKLFNLCRFAPMCWEGDYKF
jgi:hypothetical protein